MQLLYCFDKQLIIYFLYYFALFHFFVHVMSNSPEPEFLNKRACHQKPNFGYSLYTTVYIKLQQFGPFYCSLDTDVPLVFKCRATAA
jgi:hypothetical protein